MRIVFDTNVVLDVLLDREPFGAVAAELFESVERSELTGLLAATTITTVYYLARKVVGADRAQEAITNLLALFEVAPVNRTVLEAALRGRFTDFEDAVIHEAALYGEAQGIVTRNVQDFQASTLPIYLPEGLIGMLRVKGGQKS